MGAIVDNLALVRSKMADAEKRSGRAAGSVKLVAVTKTLPVGPIIEAYEAGQRAFGENYAQEFRDKTPLLPADIEWHFIGALQKNKVKYIADKAMFVHSIDGSALAAELDKRSTRKTSVLVEVNVAGEGSKSGITPENAEALLIDMAKMPHIETRGLMTMPPFFDDPDAARPWFAKLRELRDELAKKTGIALNELSMGMSGDYWTAIEEGATIVRVGTAIFGERKKQ